MPGDVSVVGFDNTLPADLVTPGLTTVAQPVTMLGETATRHVISLLTGKADTRDITAVLQVHLEVRQSTGPAPVRAAAASRRR